MISTSIHTITCELYGGLGNQLFQIAMAFAYSLKYGTNLLIKNPNNFICGQGNHPSNYHNSIYKKISFIDNLDIDHIFKEQKWGTVQSFDFLTDILKSNMSQTIMFDGYFQSDNYFYKYENQVKQIFTPEEGIINYLEHNSDIFQRFPELKEPHDFCFIGIRRGDYISRANVHNPCGMTYFKKAIDSMNKQCYYITSDDFEWAKKNFVGNNFKFIDCGSDIIQFYTSCLFNNYIISNSSFHWWASYLSIYNNPRIIAPDKWITLDGQTFSKGTIIYRNDMEIIERPVETT
jgi:hypothetical protein